MSKAPDTPDDVPNTPEAEAAAWDTALRAPDCSDETRAAYKAWRAADAANAEAFDLLQDMLSSLTAARNAPEARSMREAALAQTQPKPKSNKGLIAGITGLAAAAAIATIALNSNVLIPPQDTPAPTQIASTTEPPAAIYAPPFHATNYGELSTVSLEDGSSATLNTDSLIRTAYTETTRDIHLLKGEASFDVEKDPDRPFTVIAGDRRITAIGTVFDVRLTDSGVDILLIEGEVDVRQADTPEPVRMRAGERYTASLGSPAVAPALAANISETTLWKEQRVFFADTPLREAFAELDRYIEADIVAVDLPGDEFLVNGRFKTDDPEAFAEDMAEHFGLSIDRSEPGTIRIRPAE